MKMSRWSKDDIMNHENVPQYICLYLCQILTDFEILSLAHAIENLQQSDYYWHNIMNCTGPKAIDGLQCIYLWENKEKRL